MQLDQRPLKARHGFESRCSLQHIETALDTLRVLSGDELTARDSYELAKLEEILEKTAVLLHARGKRRKISGHRVGVNMSQPVCPAPKLLQGLKMRSTICSRRNRFQITRNINAGTRGERRLAQRPDELIQAPAIVVQRAHGTIFFNLPGIEGFAQLFDRQICGVRQ
jgi:hypothetical protein